MATRAQLREAYGAIQEEATRLAGGEDIFLLDVRTPTEQCGQAGTFNSACDWGDSSRGSTLLRVESGVHE